MSQSDPFVIALQKWLGVSMHRSFRHLLCYARDHGLSMSQLGALFHIHRMGHSGVTDLGEHLGVSSPAASQMLDRLVEQGLILRTEDPSDRRAKQIVLTEEGLRVLQESMPARQNWLHELAGALSDSEKASATEALEILAERARQTGLPSEHHK
ncbi:MAG: MarR family transcriptional regulator [Anaerolineae bacterium]|nr:MarR family transcriptional regulator [Anaerolineae bacterium]